MIITQEVLDRFADAWTEADRKSAADRKPGDRRRAGLQAALAVIGRNLADEIESDRREGVESHLILDDVVSYLRAEAGGK